MTPQPTKNRLTAERDKIQNYPGLAVGKPKESEGREVEIRRNSLKMEVHL